MPGRHQLQAPWQHVWHGDELGTKLATSWGILSTKIEKAGTKGCITVFQLFGPEEGLQMGVTSNWIVCKSPRWYTFDQE